MGTWGVNLYANDSTCDVRDTYIGFLREQLSNQEAYEKTLEKCHEYIGNQDEPLFWFALAETQWKIGRLLPEVKAKALEWIEKDGGIELWTESKNGGNRWKKTLEQLRVKLETVQSTEKRMRKALIPFQNPWGIDDVYAYRIHKDCDAKEEIAVYGKYILMQKIGEGKSFFSTDTVMRIQIYDRLFDKLPSHNDVAETMLNYRLLPISNPLNQIDRYKRRLQGKPDPFDWSEQLCIYKPVLMSAKMEQYYKNPSYPNSELTFICTAEGLLNKQHERSEGDSFCSLMWHDFHYNIGKRFALWQGIEYDIVGDGTFEYPTREQQSQLRQQFCKLD